MRLAEGGFDEVASIKKQCGTHEGRLATHLEPISRQHFKAFIRGIDDTIREWRDHHISPSSTAPQHGPPLAETARFDVLKSTAPATYIISEIRIRYTMAEANTTPMLSRLRSNLCLAVSAAG